MGVSFKLTWAGMLGCAAMAGLGTALATADNAGADANPYSVISERNIFHLNDPPPPPSPDPPKPPDVPKVMLTGFLGKGDAMRVLMAILGKDAKEPTLYLNLAPGERGGEQGREVELVKIHFDKEEAEIINSGTAMTLSVKSNSFASASAPARPAGPAGPRGSPAAPGRPGFPHPMPGPQPAPAPQTAATRSGNSSIVGGGPNYASSSAYGGAFVSGGAASFTSGAGTAPVNNNPSGQIANALFNGQTPQYRAATPTGPPVPPAVQAVGLLVTEKAGGPPAPPAIAQGL